MRLAVSSGVGDVATVIEAWVPSIRDWSRPVRPVLAGRDAGRPFWARVDRVWRESRARLWRTHGASEGTPWPLYVETAEWPHYVAAKASILEMDLDGIEDDRLMWDGPGPLHAGVTGSSAEYYHRATALTGEYGTTVPHAKNHEHGIGVGPWWSGFHPVPRRRLLAVGAGTLREIEGALLDYSAESLSELSGRIRGVSGRKALTMIGGR